MKKESWVVVANGCKARFFKVEKGRTLIELDGLIHTEGHRYEHELKCSKPGNSCTTTSHMQHGLEDQTSQKKLGYNTFAKEVLQRLEEAPLERIYIAAAPSFLGILRQHMSKQLSNLIHTEVNKDITELKVEEIKTHFPIGL